MPDTPASPPSISADDIPQMIESPQFAALPPEQRSTIAEDALYEAAPQVLGGAQSPEDFTRWHQFTGEVRKQVGSLGTWGESVQEGAHKLYDMGKEAGKSLVMLGADAADVKNEDGWHLPLRTTGAVLDQFGRKAEDFVDTSVAKISDQYRGLNDSLKQLKSHIDSGKLAGQTPEQLGEWATGTAGHLAERQAAWNRAARTGGSNLGLGDAEPPTADDHAYAAANSLLHPRNMNLLQRYVRIGNPDDWSALEKNLVLHSARAKLNDEQQKTLDSSQAVQLFEKNKAYGQDDWHGAAAMAGDPINLASTFVPLFSAAKIAEGGSVMSNLLRGTAHAVALGEAGLNINDPYATWEQHKQTARDMLLASLGMHTIGTAAKGAVSMAKRIRGKPAPIEVRQPSENPFSGPIEAPPPPDYKAMKSEAPRPPIPGPPLGPRDLLRYLNEHPISTGYAGAPLPDSYRQFIFHESGQPIDVVARQAYEQGLIEAPTPSALMYEAIEAVVKHHDEWVARTGRAFDGKVETRPSVTPADGPEVQPEPQRFEPRQQRPTIPDSPLGGRDVLDYLNEHPIAVPRKGSTGTAGEHDWREQSDLPPYYRKFIANEAGLPIDVVAQNAYEAGLIHAPSADALMEAAHQAIAARRQYRVENRQRQRALLDEERRVTNFDKVQTSARIQGKPAVDFEQMVPGDKLHIDGEEVTVKQVLSDDEGRPDTVVLEDGKKFGLLSFDAKNHDAIFVDAFEPKPRPGTGAEPDAFMPPAQRGPLPSLYPSPLSPPGKPWSGKVQTLHGIRKHLMQSVGLPAVGVGRFKRALGIYKLKPETIRLQAINDIPVLSHELGHAIHYRVLSPKAGGPAADFGGRYDAELMPLGQPTSGPGYTPALIRREGVAEFTRLWLTDPAQAYAKAPAFAGFWTREIQTRNPALMTGLDQARQMIADYVVMPAVEKARAQISFDPAAEQSRPSARQWLQSAYAKWINTLQPALNVLHKAVELDPSIAAEARNVETWMENHRGGWASKAHSDVFGYQTDLHGKILGEGMSSILKDLQPGDHELFSTYLALKRAAEIEASGRRSGFEQGRIPASEMNLLGQRFEATRQKLLKWADHSLQLLVDGGLLDQASADTMRAAGKDYVPFYRLYEKLNGVSFGPEASRNSGGFVDLNSGIKRLKGSDRAIVDPLQSLMKNAYMFRKLAEQNHIGVEFFKVIGKVQGHGQWGEGIQPKMTATTVPHAEVVKQLIKEGVIRREADLPVNADLTLKLWEAMKRPDTQNGEVIVFDQGQRQHWEVKDPLLMEALKTADADAVKLWQFTGPTLTKALTLPTRILRTGATGGPWFAIPNFLRDQVHAGIYSKSGYIPFWDGVRGAIEVFKKNGMYQRWEEAGGRFSGFTTGTEAFTSLLEDALPKDPSIARQAVALANPRNFMRALGAAGELLEEATRVGEFSRAVGKGMTDMEAANASKVVSLNFARAGERARALNMLIAFFNAKLQDIDQFARAHANPKTRGGVMARAFMLITVPSILCWALGKDDKDIQALPEWRKNLFWNINLAPVARALGRSTGFILSLPKPFLLGSVYGTSIERALDMATGRDPNGAAKALKNIYDNSINFGETVTNLAGMKPIIEGMTGYDFFRGQQIVPERLKDLPKPMQYDLTTSHTAKALGKATGQSPLMIDHMVSAYLATGGKWGVDAIDYAMTKLGMADAAPGPAKDLMEYPILNRFAGSPYASNAFVERFYNGVKDMEGIIGVFKKQSAQMTADEQARFWKQSGDEVQQYLAVLDPTTRQTRAGQVRKTMASLSNIGKAMRQIQGDQKMNPDVKREKLMELAKQRNETAEWGFRNLFPESVKRRLY